MTTVEHRVRRAADHPFVHRLGRAGLASRGVLFVSLGVLAVQVGFGDRVDQVDSGGVLRALAGSGLGLVLLYALVAGFAGLALWQAAEAATGGESAHGWTGQLAAAGRSLLYGGLAVSTVVFLAGLGNGGSSDGESRTWTALALGVPGGWLLVAAVGLAIAAVGATLAVQGMRGEYCRGMELDRLPAWSRAPLCWLGTVGNVARGIAVGSVGCFLLRAAVNDDPRQARGLDDSLRAFAVTALGPWLLLTLAVGLIGYGVFSLFQAWLRRT